MRSNWEYIYIQHCFEFSLRVFFIDEYTGFFRPVIYQQNGVDCYMVDGGLVSNYPVHCFDGKLFPLIINTWDCIKANLLCTSKFKFCC